LKKISNFLAFILEFWHYRISPFLSNACRHEPTCSIYGAQALRQHGIERGLWLAIKRIARCHPWGSQGFDPVPGIKLKSK